MKPSAAFCFALLSLFPMSARTSAAESKRPNILFIFADDQSYKTVGCYPESWPWVRTPNIDRLAATGVRFHAAYLGAWCMPSRATLLTGRQPHGIESMRMDGKYPRSVYDAEKTPFWPAEFRKQGYQTAQIGKWHTGIDSGWGRDWDHQIVWNRPLHPENAGAYYEKQILAIDGVEKEVDGYPADNYTQWACDYIKGAHRDPAKPWYLWLCYGSIHGPSKPAARHNGCYKESEVAVPSDILPPRPGKPDYLNKTQSWSRAKDGTIIAKKNDEVFGDESGKKTLEFANWVRQVNECVPAVDEGVGRLLDALRESGQFDNTLVIYTADQGFGMGEHGFRTKLAPYDATYRSPLIVSMPSRLPQKKVCRHAVNGADLVATFCSFAGVQLPWRAHGHDLTPLLKNPGADWPHVCLYEGTGETYGSDVTITLRDKPEVTTHHGVPWYAAIVDGTMKYVRYLSPDQPEELYDLQVDPEELTNLAAGDADREMLRKLRARWREAMVEAEAGFLDHLPAVKSAR
ncbi:MAG: sulfatase-like hydrolase/transferase [Verrucomicrobiaceae bacterium]|nr:sulfatase-like hydrolase/transferase [Verrucomicrobiaceae bacterium]